MAPIIIYKDIFALRSGVKRRSKYATESFENMRAVIYNKLLA